MTPFAGYYYLSSRLVFFGEFRLMKVRWILRAYCGISYIITANHELQHRRFTSNVITHLSSSSFPVISTLDLFNKV